MAKDGETDNLGAKPPDRIEIVGIDNHNGNAMHAMARLAQDSADNRGRGVVIVEIVEVATGLMDETRRHETTQGTRYSSMINTGKVRAARELQGNQHMDQGAQTGVAYSSMVSQRLSPLFYTQVSGIHWYREE